MIVKNMKNEKLLITDFDGCLTNEFNLDEAMVNLLILNEVYDIVISTGREYGTMEKLISRKDFWKYVKMIILANGCVTISKQETKYAYLSWEEKENVMKMVRELQVFYYGVELYFSLPEKTIYIDDMDFAMIQLENPIYEIKIAVPLQEKMILNWILNYTSYKDMNAFVDIVTNKGYYYMEIKSKGVNKFNAVGEFVKREKYKQLYTLGDDVNDIHLFCFGIPAKKFTTNEKLKLQGLKLIKDCKNLVLDSGENLSSIYTNNKVVAFRHVVCKVFANSNQYQIEKEAYQIVDPMYRPNLIGTIEEESTLFVERCKIPKSLCLEQLIPMMNRYHQSTSREGEIYELGGVVRYSSWEDYLLAQLREWEETMKFYVTNVSQQIESLKKYISAVRPKRRQVSLIHRDIRLDNIGELNGCYVLFDYERAMWGNPIWDFARLFYEVECEEDKQAIYELSGYTKKELHIHRCLYAFSFLHYFYSAEYQNRKEIEKCKRIIKEFEHEV